MDPEFMEKVLDEDNGLPEYDFVRPSDLGIPTFAMGNVYALILDVPMVVGSVVRQAYLFGKRMAEKEDKDDWMPMPYRGSPMLEAYLNEVGWFNGPVAIVSPPCPGTFVCITTKGLETLVDHFPSDVYKKRKQVV